MAGLEKDDLDHHLSKHFVGCTAPYKVRVSVLLQLYIIHK